MAEPVDESSGKRLPKDPTALLSAGDASYVQDTLGSGTMRSGDPAGSKAPQQPEQPAAGLDSTVPSGEGYLIRERIGQGAFAEVYRGTAPGGIPVAIKRIVHPIDRDEAKRELKSLELIKRLKHPFLLATHAFWLSADRLYIVMELADRTLRDRLRGCPPSTGLPPDELIAYMAQAAQALDYLHGQDVLHRDIKPENILLVQGYVKLGDFGLARNLPGNQMSATGAGTPRYMAPEAWRGTVNRRSDQYSLALTYAELRLGRPPFPSQGSVMEVMMAHLESLPDLSPLPEGEQQVLLRALAKEPGERYETCCEFVQALNEALVEGGVIAVSPSSRLAASAGSGPGGASGGSRQTPSPAGLQGPHTSFAVDRTSALPPGIESAEPFGTLAPSGGARPPVAAAPSGATPAFRSRPQAPRRLPAILTGAAMIALMIAGAVTAWCLVGPRQPSKDPPDPGNGNAPGKIPEVQRAGPLEPPAWLGRTAPREDFKLQVTMLGSRKDSAGTHLLTEGDTVAFRIEVERPAYVGIWTLDDDRSITQVFPNKYETDRWIRAGQVRTIPSTEHANTDYVLEATVSRNTEWVWVVASTERWDELKGEQKGPFYVFESAEARRKGQAHLRGIVTKVLKEGKAAVADKLFPFRVSPRPAPEP